MNILEVSEHDKKYWQYEYDVIARYFIPLLSRWGIESKNTKLLDVGCGDGGGVAAFYDAGFICKGFDIEPRRVQLANHLKGKREFEMVIGDIYQNNFPYSDELFDLIVLHDVIEHLEKKEEALIKLKNCLSEKGRILITFPPYYSAYGAHQQLLNKKILKLPYVHLIPYYNSLIKLSKNENNIFVAEIEKLINMKMGITQFEKIVKNCNLEIEKTKKYIIGPNHIRFGLKPISSGIFGKVPFLNEFIINGVVYLIKKRGK